jgi:hypothetical protein
MSAQIELIRPDKGLSSLRRTKWIRKDDEKAAFVENVFEPGTRKSKVYFDRMNRIKPDLELLSLLCASAADLDYASGPAAFFSALDGTQQARRARADDPCTVAHPRSRTVVT